MFLRIIGSSTDYTALYPRRQQYLQPPLWESQMLQDIHIYTLYRLATTFNWLHLVALEMLRGRKLVLVYVTVKEEVWCFLILYTHLWIDKANSIEQRSIWEVNCRFFPWRSCSLCWDYCRRNLVYLFRKFCHYIFPQIVELGLSSPAAILLDVMIITKLELRSLSPRANCTDRVTAACRRSYHQPLRIEGATWSVRKIPTAVFSTL
jgi:hypothetical protein